MAIPMLQQGRIVWVRVRDPNGENEKERPAVIVSSTSDIHPDEPVVAVAVTSQLPDPLPDDYVELPWHRNNHSKTGLKQRCAANCKWVIEVQQTDILKLAGVVPAAKLLEIINKLPQPSGGDPS